jgi:hypothetical protein
MATAYQDVRVEINLGLAALLELALLLGEGPVEHDVPLWVAGSQSQRILNGARYAVRKERNRTPPPPNSCIDSFV